MRNSKQYIYKDHEGKEWALAVGVQLQAKNGDMWAIKKIGPLRVKFENITRPETTYRYTAHWHFIENVIKRIYNHN